MKRILYSLINCLNLGFNLIIKYRIIYLFILFLSFLLTSHTTFKLLTLENKINTIKNNITLKLENYVKIEYSNVENNYHNGALGLANCLKIPLNETELTSKMNEIKNELENLFNESELNFAFKYKDIYTGFSLSYNSNQNIFAASTIKAPEAIYIYKEAENKNIDLNDTLTYTDNFYSDGTGILKDTPQNKAYNIHDLVKYSIVNSDNIAHLILNSKYGSQNIYNYWKNLGTTVIYNNNGPWGNINANDATIVMEELYNYYMDNNYSFNEELINYFINSWKIISNPNKNIKIASKSGWSNTSLHDMALIFDENPYILVILTNRGYVEYQSFFNKVSSLIAEFQNLYWEEKMNRCINI